MTNGETFENNDAYIWLCRNGHKQAATEVQMRSAYLRPVCSLCGMPLETKVMRMPDMEQGFGVYEEPKTAEFKKIDIFLAVFFALWFVFTIVLAVVY